MMNSFQTWFETTVSNRYELNKSLKTTKCALKVQNTVEVNQNDYEELLNYPHFKTHSIKL